MSKRLVLLYSAALCLLLNFIVPPFQNPDEPQHFRAVLARALGSGRGPEIEERVIEQMDRFDWWRKAGMGRPAELPRRFADIPFMNLPVSEAATSQLLLYHTAAGWLLKLVPSDDFLVLYYVCRLFSAALFCGSLLLLAAAFSIVARDLGGTAGLGFFFVLFLPQFSVLSVSVNPEAAATFWGALFFCAVAAWMSGRAGWPVLMILPVVALAGFLTDRSSFYLLPMALLLPFFSLKRDRPARSLAIIGMSLFAALLVLSWAAWFFPGPVFRGLSTVQSFLFRAPITAAGTAAQSGGAGANLLRFVDSVWLRFGWMAFSAEAAVYFVWRAAVLLAFLGMLVLAGRRLLDRKTDPANHTSPGWTGRLIALSAAATALQLAALLRASFSLQIPPQGRYLFPVVFPVALLFVLGLEGLGDVFGRRAGRAAVAAFLGFEIIFFAFAVWDYLAPVFHLTVSAPHPGI